VCEQLAQGRYVKRSGRDSNLRHDGCKSIALITTRRHSIIDRQIGSTKPTRQIMIQTLFLHFLEQTPDSILLSNNINAAISNKRLSNFVRKI